MNGSVRMRMWDMFIPMVIGIVAVVIKKVTANALLDPLLLALMIGIFLKLCGGEKWLSIAQYDFAPSIFIPVGALFYGAANLDFQHFFVVDSHVLFILIFVVLSYIIISLVLSRMFFIQEKVGYLIAAGSAICGASAIAITSKSVDAESDEVSMGLLAVFSSALLGLFVFLPLCVHYGLFSDEEVALFSGCLFQFTGFVKAVAARLPEELGALAITIKTVRYTGLLLLIPVFSSATKERFHIPWYIIGFLGLGILLSVFPAFGVIVRPMCKSVFEILWSIAMAAIGLNTCPRKVFSVAGAKAALVSFLSFLCVSCIFFMTLQAL